MQGMRELLRGSLARTLAGVRDEDRVCAAWTVACGRAMAERGRVAAYQDGVVRIEVTENVWLRQMEALRTTLEREMTRISGVKVQAIEFTLKRSKE
jgi:hypothetical protein